MSKKPWEKSVQVLDSVRWWYKLQKNEKLKIANGFIDSMAKNITTSPHWINLDWLVSLQCIEE